ASRRTAAGLPSGMSAGPFPVRPIGFVRSPVVEPVDEGWGEVESRIELLSEYRAGLRGLDQFSHVLVVAWLHQADFDPARRLVRRGGADDMPLVGIFAQRAKDRPNPFGITVAAIVRAEETGLVVRGLDAIDGTPILDLKPYFPDFDAAAKARLPEWVARLMQG